MESTGGGVLTIRTLRDRGDVVIEFSDSGPGLEEPEKIFDPFYTTKPVGKGSGLGLSICYGIIQEHGGRITDPIASMVAPCFGSSCPPFLHCSRNREAFPRRP